MLQRLPLGCFHWHSKILNNLMIGNGLSCSFASSPKTLKADAYYVTVVCMSNCRSVSMKTCLFIFGGVISGHTWTAEDDLDFKLMAPHTTTEMQEQMVIWHTELGKSTVEIAELAGCSEHTVREVLRLRRETGNVHNTFTQPRGGPRSLNQGDITYISSLLDANPTLYLDELQIKLAETQHVDVSIATLSRTVHHLAMTHKKVLKAALERNKLL
jgi:transposase